MKCFKFVTKDLLSPGVAGIIDYSNFGKEITVKADPESAGQCAAGIHVIPYLKYNVDFSNIVISEKIIILDVKPEDIVYQNKDKTGKMRVKAATPLRLANKKEIAHIRNLICTNSTDNIYVFALTFDKCGKQNTRNALCHNIYYAGVSYAYLYAKNIDKKPTNITRKAACKDHYYAYLYAKNIDKCKHPDTWNAAKNDCFKSRYITELGSY